MYVDWIGGYGVGGGVCLFCYVVSFVFGVGLYCVDINGWIWFLDWCIGWFIVLVVCYVVF